LLLQLGDLGLEHGIVDLPKAVKLDQPTLALG
jgi:hypothetical protein